MVDWGWARKQQWWSWCREDRRRQEREVRNLSASRLSGMVCAAHTYQIVTGSAAERGKTVMPMVSGNLQVTSTHSMKDSRTAALVWRCLVQFEKTSRGSCLGSVSGWQGKQSLSYGPQERLIPLLQQQDENGRVIHDKQNKNWQKQKNKTRGNMLLDLIWSHLLSWCGAGVHTQSRRITINRL